MLLPSTNRQTTVDHTTNELSPALSRYIFDFHISLPVVFFGKLIFILHCRSPINMTPLLFHLDGGFRRLLLLACLNGVQFLPR